MWIRIPIVALIALALCSCADEVTCGAPAAPGPDVLLVTLDTLRADHLGAYGAPPDATPALDALAARGVVFERMLAASSRTAPSHASLFTSHWVRDHGIGYRNGSTRLGDEPTLASRFAAAGYQTAAFVSNSMLRRRIGLDAGFDLYDDALPDHEANRPVFERTAEKTTARATRWLRETREAPQPRFLWVHYNDPHGPYTPPARYVKEPPGEPATTLPVLQIQRGFHGIPAYQALDGQDDPRQYLARYAGEIRYLDDSIGALVESFERDAGRSGAIIAITADHGESLGEEDMWFSHGFATTPNLAHVPFLLLADGLPGGRVSTPVHHVDVLPTLLELAGLPVPEDAAGRALGPVLRGEAQLAEDRPLYVDVGAEVSVYRGKTFLRARFGAALGNVAEGSFGTYRWDGGASWQRLDDSTSLALLALAYDRDRAPLHYANAPDADDQRRLRALGYLPPTPQTQPGPEPGAEPDAEPAAPH
jgi:arylsulfatase